MKIDVDESVIAATENLREWLIKAVPYFEQYGKCLRGEHEAATICVDDTMLAFFVLNSVRVDICTHCRCLFVAR